jgi:two-component system cell cycle sensor histidine kinase/response regulator CckA
VTQPAPAAVLLLDETGRVTAANATARALWQTGDGELIGESFVALFVFEIVSTDPEFLEAQWDALLISALDKSSTLSAQPREGAPCEVCVRLEQAFGPAPGYMATIQPPPPVLASAAIDDSVAGLALLAEKGAAGFFDLHLAAGRVRFSPAWKKIAGYTDAELPDTLATWHQLIHPEDTAAAPDKVGKKLTVGPRPFNVEFRLKHRLGHWTWVQCVGLQVMNTSAGT